MKTWEAAVEILRETNNPAVMWGDSGLLDQIHDRAGFMKKSHPLDRWSAVLKSLGRSPGLLIAGTTLCGKNRRVRCFWLPEHAPERLKSHGK